MESTNGSGTGTSEFWLQRFIKYGHTGWTNRKIYWFDQVCRMQRLQAFLESQDIKPGHALDFGCGSGDFSRLLSNLGWDVIAYDPYVSPTFSTQRLTSTNDWNVVNKNGPYDLIVSVTVLDHCIDYADFRRCLRDISWSLKPNGRFFFLEYALDTPKPKSQHQAYRLLSQWAIELGIAGLDLSDVKPYFHPYEATIPAWESYRKMVLVKLYSLLAKTKLSLVNTVLHGIINKCLTDNPYSPPRQSPIKILTGQKCS